MIIMHWIKKHTGHEAAPIAAFKLGEPSTSGNKIHKDAYTNKRTASMPQLFSLVFSWKTVPKISSRL